MFEYHYMLRLYFFSFSIYRFKSLIVYYLLIKIYKYNIYPTYIYYILNKLYI